MRVVFPKRIIQELAIQGLTRQEYCIEISEKEPIASKFWKKLAQLRSLEVTQVRKI